MATSTFLKYFRDGLTDTVATSMDVWIVPQSITPTSNSDFLRCTEVAGRPGLYERANTDDGEYKVYIFTAGGSSTPLSDAVLHDQNIWHGDKRITTISDHFDSTDGYKLKTTGLKDQTKTVTSLTAPTPDYIGQLGRDSGGNNYVSIALVGTVWAALDGSGSTNNLDGGSSASVYLAEQQIDGGSSTSVYLVGQQIDGGTV